MRPIEAIIFDLGGTLIKYSGSYTKWPALETPGFRGAYNSLAANGIPLPDFNDFRATGFNLLPHRWKGAIRGEKNLQIADLVHESLLAMGLESPPDEHIAEAGAAYEKGISEQAEAIEGGTAVLEFVQSQQLKIGLLSNTMFRGVTHRADMHRFGLLDYFDTMLFSGDVGMWKPTAVPFLQVAADLEIDPKNCIYIGDDPASDIVGGHRAGMRVIHLINEHFHHPEGVIPDAQVTHLGEIPEVLANWL